MENHSTTTDPARAGQLLAGLDADRAALVDRVTTPTWYVVALAALTAAFVAGPLLGDRQTALFGMIAPAALVLALELRQRRLVRPAGPGAAGWGVVAVLLGGVLLLLSVSFGLVASGLDAWVVLPALAAGALTYLAVGRVDAHVRRRTARVA
ncbi:hypothetical protein [Cellulomonas wangsupingiae]|uniref:Uncharacterized protein n=1 Tax=Cellulomonas wangsupingiae TaxID=2968085 RepID=A0ABY5K2C2_9CELL|nr:hypothetical protein [Cellulomonas wangsupingiae]MCC2336168.1 hypothetical protein [Cellulomonas wangsupingiae]MCM0641392.1 hypothetical protein [Cellulomonas wangsupingiae]UUI64587.1 hypothetical protein NP075_15925 [Cellulomonas wangsupingiae]